MEDEETTALDAGGEDADESGPAEALEYADTDWTQEGEYEPEPQEESPYGEEEPAAPPNAWDDPATGGNPPSFRSPLSPALQREIAALGPAITAEELQQFADAAGLETQTFLTLAAFNARMSAHQQQADAIVAAHLQPEMAAAPEYFAKALPRIHKQLSGVTPELRAHRKTTLMAALVPLIEDAPETATLGDIAESIYRTFRGKSAPARSVVPPALRAPSPSGGSASGASLPGAARDRGAGFPTAFERPRETPRGPQRERGATAPGPTSAADYLLNRFGITGINAALTREEVKHGRR